MRINAVVEQGGRHDGHEGAYTYRCTGEHARVKACKHKEHRGGSPRPNPTHPRPKGSWRVGKASIAKPQNTKRKSETTAKAIQSTVNINTNGEATTQNK